MVDSADELERFQVPDDDEGARLDRVLMIVLDGVSRSYAQSLIKGGCVRLDGKISGKPGQRVSAGQAIEVERRPREIVDTPRTWELEVLHEDEHLIVVDKPAGVLVHPTGRLQGNTLSEVCEERFGPLPQSQGPDRPGVVHRLDRGTSGVIVLVRTDLAFEAMKSQFKRREVEKVYRAIIHGEPRFATSWIDEPLGRLPHNPDRICVVPKGPKGNGRQAETYYEVAERFRGFARVDCMPKTGRTHQIRVHMNHIGHPIVGDRLYKRRGPHREPLPADAPSLDRQALHAARIAFRHPSTGERVSYESEDPADFTSLLAWLRENRAV